MGEGYIQHADHQSAGLHAEGCKTKTHNTNEGLGLISYRTSVHLTVPVQISCSCCFYVSKLWCSVWTAVFSSGHYAFQYFQSLLIGLSTITQQTENKNRDLEYWFSSENQLNYCPSMRRHQDPEPTPAEHQMLDHFPFGRLILLCKYWAKDKNAAH